MPACLCSRHTSGTWLGCLVALLHPSRVCRRASAQDIGLGLGLVALSPYYIRREYAGVPLLKTYVWDSAWLPCRLITPVESMPACLCSRHTSGTRLGCLVALLHLSRVCRRASSQDIRLGLGLVALSPYNMSPPPYTAPSVESTP